MKIAFRDSLGFGRGMSNNSFTYLEVVALETFDLYTLESLDSLHVATQPAE
jgi:hypothetical protein